jgi:hypothetical protein
MIGLQIAKAAKVQIHERAVVKSHAAKAAK